MVGYILQLVTHLTCFAFENAHRQHREKPWIKGLGEDKKYNPWAMVIESGSIKPECKIS